MKKKPKKPRGALKLYKVTDVGVTEIKNELPDTKTEIEATIAGLFIRIATKSHDFCCTNWTQTQEQDLDFEIYCNGGKSYLELAELMPADQRKGGYAADPTIDQSALAHRMLEIIKSKSDKYQGISTPIDLVVYLTDFKSNLSPSAELYLKSLINQAKPIFRRVYYFVPFPGNNDGIIITYYPNDVQGPLPPPGMAINLVFQ